MECGYSLKKSICKPAEITPGNDVAQAVDKPMRGGASGLSPTFVHDHAIVDEWLSAKIGLCGPERIDRFGCKHLQERMSFIDDQGSAVTECFSDARKELRDVRHPVQHADCDQGDIKAIMQRRRQGMNVCLDELRVVCRQRSQFPCLSKERRGLVDPDHGLGAQSMQRNAFPAVITANLNDVLPLHADAAEHMRESGIEAREVRPGDLFAKSPPSGGLFVMRGRLVPRIAVAGYRRSRSECVLGLCESPADTAATLLPSGSRT